MAEGAIAATAVSTIVQFQSAAEQAKAQVKALEAEAETKRLESLELLERFNINAESLKKDVRVHEGEQVALLAKSGVAVGSGSSLSIMVDNAKKLQRELDNREREAQFKVDQLNRGADIDIELAGDVRKAGRLRRIGIILGGVGNTASIVQQSSGGGGAKKRGAKK